MSQTTQSGNTTNEESKLVVIEQGGIGNLTVGRIYKNYDFTTPKGWLWYPEMNSAYYEICKELINILSKDKVVYLMASWKKTRLEKRDFSNRWTPPVFVEDGKMQEFKQELKAGKYGKQLWADYMWYFEEEYRALITNMLTNNRDYNRKIAIVQEKLDMSLAERMCACGHEEAKGIGVRIFPHSKIKHLENDRETIRSYVHSDDFIIHIACSPEEALVHVQINHNYMSFDEFIEIIEPLFEKRGMKFVNKKDPYAHFPPDYVEHNHYPCAGYQFFD